MERIRHAHGLEPGTADRTEPLAPDGRVGEGFRQKNQILEFREVAGHDRARLPNAGFTDHVVPGKGSRMPAGGRLAFGRPPGLVENHLLVTPYGLAHGLRKLEPIEILEAFRVDGDDIHFLGVHEMAHHVPEREISLVAH